jgi:hypothetical protein
MTRTGIAALTWLVLTGMAACYWAYESTSLMMPGAIFGIVGVLPVVLVWAIVKLFVLLPRGALIALGLVIALPVAAYGVVIGLEPFRHHATTFETPAQCADREGKAARNSLTADWADATLTVRTSVCMNCAHRVGSVTAQVLGDRVLLNVRAEEPADGMYAACDCARPVVVRLAQLPKRDYSIMGIPMFTGCI